MWRNNSGGADCGSIASRFPSMCIRVFKAEKPRILSSRSALRLQCAHANLNLIASFRMKSLLTACLGSSQQGSNGVLTKRGFDEA
jgi:hypothetical protein